MVGETAVAPVLCEGSATVANCSPYLRDRSRELLRILAINGAKSHLPHESGGMNAALRFRLTSCWPKHKGREREMNTRF